MTVIVKDHVLDPEEIKKIIALYPTKNKDWALYALIKLIKIVNEAKGINLVDIYADQIESNKRYIKVNIRGEPI